MFVSGNFIVLDALERGTLELDWNDAFCFLFLFSVSVFFWVFDTA